MKTKEYFGALQMLDNYDLKMIDMFINELSLKDNKAFSFLKKIDIFHDVEFFFYESKKDKKDTDFSNSSGKAIYLNVPVEENETLKQRADNIFKIFPMIIYKLYCYNQKRKYGKIFTILSSIPVIKNFINRLSINKIYSFIEESYNKMKEITPIEFTMLKEKYGFPSYLFDESERELVKDLDEGKKTEDNKVEVIVLEANEEAGNSSSESSESLIQE